MIVIHTPPEGGPVQYDSEDLLCSETLVLEHTVDLPWSEIKEGLRHQRPHVLRAVAWLLRKRQDPGLQFGAFNPKARELKARFDADEVELWAGEIERNTDADGEMREAAYRDLEGLALDRGAAAKTIAAVRAGKGKRPRAALPADG